ncbi:hypothetical protein [Polynucleobacter sp. AP-Nino-20-G2]|uniref:hypothetical protein n=1 Tax=Polynucleobacter sp. AP-Nino-20-G2 TaxID=2576917 RepID=UPI001BFE65C2|nr:hypothetical protein [Polynucleobacter sp. AP-Nino-20-G2]QWE17086.1 hypothetical protein FD960_02360 [Polynucleobacter sp. AP-Nino-20-G2]
MNLKLSFWIKLIGIGIAFWVIVVGTLTYQSVSKVADGAGQTIFDACMREHEQSSNQAACDSERDLARKSVMSGIWRFSLN